MGNQTVSDLIDTADAVSVPRYVQAPNSSWSSSSSKSDRPEYATKDSKWIKVKKWEDDLAAVAASKYRSITCVKYKKRTAVLDHEYLIFDVSDEDTLFVTERTDETPPDLVMTNAQETKNLLATLTLSSDSLPERTFARILTLVCEKAPNYHWYSNNCYWYAGSVYETLRVGLRGYKEERTSEWKHRGMVDNGLFWVKVGTSPEPVSIPTAHGPGSITRHHGGVATSTPLPGEQGKLPWDRLIGDFGQPANLHAYKLLHEKNIGPLQEIFDDPIEEKLTIALRGLVGSILHDLAGPLEAGQKLEDLPVLRGWLRRDGAIF